MNYTTTILGNHCHIAMNGNFTFADNVVFREIITKLDNNEIHIVTINFAQVDFIDSAALGMLLLLRDEAKSRKAQLKLTEAKGHIRKMFEITRFDRIFGD